jgi:hypothetical protein
MNRSLKPLLAQQNGLVMLAGSFSTNGTSAPTNVKGAGVTPTRTGVGKYKLTLKEPAVDLISADFQLSLGTPAARSVQIASDPAKNASGFFEVSCQVVDGSGVAAEVAAASGNAIHWTLVCRQSSAGPTS